MSNDRIAAAEWVIGEFPEMGERAGATKLMERAPDAFPSEQAAASFYRRFLVQYRAPSGLPDLPPADSDSTAATSFEESREKGTAAFTFKGSVDTPMTIDELLVANGVDLDHWEIERVKLGSWGVTAKIKEYEVVEDGGKRKSIPTGQYLEAGKNFSCAVVLVRRKEKLEEVLEAQQDRIISALSDVKSGWDAGERRRTRRAPFGEPDASGSGRLLELSIFDLHLGKLGWGEETGRSDWDTKIASSAALTAAADLLDFFPAYERIWLPLGHDFFNSDGPGDNDSGGRTTRGTAQDEDTRWAKSLSTGVDVALALVELCLHRAPVDITIMRGNHDEQRCVMMGKLLQEVYRDHPHVTVDAGPATLKCKKWGDVFLATCHGQNEKLQKVVTECAMRFPMEFSSTTWREIHTGHGHRMQNASMLIEGCEEQSVRWRMIPSLSGQDAYHSKNLYHSHRCAESYLWDKESLYLGHHSHNLPA